MESPIINNYEKEDRMYVQIKKCSKPGVWYEERVGLKFPLARTCEAWNHVKVSLMGMESEVYHGDYGIVHCPPEPSQKPRLTQEQMDAFLAELTKLTQKHGIFIDCRHEGYYAPVLVPFFEPGSWWFDDLTWDHTEQKYTAEFCRDQYTGYDAPKEE